MDLLSALPALTPLPAALCFTDTVGAQAQSASGRADYNLLATWTGEACSGSTDSGWSLSRWKGVTCEGGRVISLNLTGLGASGPLSVLGSLTAVTDLILHDNNFQGVHSRASLCRACSLLLDCSHPPAHESQARCLCTPGEICPALRTCSSSTTASMVGCPGALLLPRFMQLSIWARW